MMSAAGLVAGSQTNLEWGQRRTFHDYRGKPRAGKFISEGGDFMKTIRRNKILELPELLAIRAADRAAHRSVVWTNGCFDLLHPGHIRSLEAASQQGDVLVVGINSDESVRQLKGKSRPILTAQDRAELLAALECVDHVIIFAELTPNTILELLQPDVHCKGAQYEPHYGTLPERAVIEAYGGRIVFLPMLPGNSTTDLIERVRRLEGMP
jgi:rfaE bifunctional protein nucleotidyltransferase chain/domain